MQYLQAYRLFGKPKRGIARADFKHKLMDLGIMINDTELDALIKKYDPDGNYLLGLVSRGAFMSYQLCLLVSGVVVVRLYRDGQGPVAGVCEARHAGRLC